MRFRLKWSCYLEKNDTCLNDLESKLAEITQ